MLISLWRTAYKISSLVCRTNNCFQFSCIRTDMKVMSFTIQSENVVLKDKAALSLVILIQTWAHVCWPLVFSAWLLQFPYLYRFAHAHIKQKAPGNSEVSRSLQRLASALTRYGDLTLCGLKLRYVWYFLQAWRFYSANPQGLKTLWLTST